VASSNRPGVHSVSDAAITPVHSGRRRRCGPRA
jgi:hypothetical protein